MCWCIGMVVLWVSMCLCRLLLMWLVMVFIVSLCSVVRLVGEKKVLSVVVVVFGM